RLFPSTQISIVCDSVRERLNAHDVAAGRLGRHHVQLELLRLTLAKRCGKRVVDLVLPHYLQKGAAVDRLGADLKYIGGGWVNLADERLLIDHQKGAVDGEERAFQTHSPLSILPFDYGNPAV